MLTGEDWLNNQPIDRLVRRIVEPECREIDPTVPESESLEIGGELRDMLRSRTRAGAEQTAVDVLGKRARHLADGGTAAAGLSARDRRGAGRRRTLVPRSPGEGGPA